MVRNPFKSKIMIRIFRLTQGPTNTASYRVARQRLKRKAKDKEQNKGKKKIKEKENECKRRVSALGSYKKKKKKKNKKKRKMKKKKKTTAKSFIQDLCGQCVLHAVSYTQAEAVIEPLMN